MNNPNQTVVTTGAIGGVTNATVTTSFGASASTPRFPASWKTYKTKVNPMYGDREAAESPATGQQMWVGNLAIGNQQGKFHYDLFSKLHPDVKSYVIAVCESNVAVASNIAFSSESDWLLFNQWVAEREELFGGRENLYSYSFPPLPTELGPSVCLPRMDDEPMVNMAAWMIENCKSEVYHSGDHYVFTHPDDAFLYKLKFKRPNLTQE